jgi:hypothetical protein
MNDIRENLKKADVLVYGMAFKEPAGIGPNLPWGLSDLSSSLTKLCSMTGGMAFYPRNPAELKSAFEALALELKSQYSVSFRPSSFVKEGQWRQLRYKVTTPNRPGWENVKLNVRGREGYFFHETTPGSVRRSLVTGSLLIGDSPKFLLPTLPQTASLRNKML